MANVSADIYRPIASAHVARDLGDLRLIWDETPATNLP
jgi:hypothetical protein